MDWLNIAVHRDRYRELIAAVPVFGDRPPEPLVIACPQCKMQFVADLASYDEPWELEADEWAAMVRLDEECPDHAHRFTVT